MGYDATAYVVENRTATITFNRPEQLDAVSPAMVADVVERDQLWLRAQDLAAGIAAWPGAATEGTVRAIWESLDRPCRAAMELGPLYRLGNPLGVAGAAEHPLPRHEPNLR